MTGATGAAGPGGASVIIRTFAPVSGNWREAWLACSAGYTAIGSSVYIPSSSNLTVSLRSEPGTMIGSSGQSGTAGGLLPGGSFNATPSGGSSPNGYHWSTSGNVNVATLKIIVTCIPN